MHSAGHFDNAKHPRLSLGQPYRGPHASPKEGVMIHQGLTQHEPDVGGGTDNSLQLIGFDDANWGNDSETRRSRSGFLFTLGTGAVSYKSRK
jgi:hypothetical protein